MTTRITERSRVAHPRLIRALVGQYESLGYFVQADHIGHPNGSPPAVNGHIPDVAAYSSGVLRVIAEAETCDTISDSDTRDQWLAFSRSPYRFEAIVPKSCLQDAQMQASMSGARR